jgi:hypothetical protein
MKPLVELPHDPLRCGLQHAVGIDSVIEVFENAVELSFEAQKDLRVDLVLDRHREHDRLERSRLRFETEGFVERGEARLRLG